MVQYFITIIFMPSCQVLSLSVCVCVCVYITSKPWLDSRWSFYCPCNQPHTDTHTLTHRDTIADSCVLRVNDKMLLLAVIALHLLNIIFTHKFKHQLRVQFFHVFLFFFCLLPAAVVIAAVVVAIVVVGWLTVGIAIKIHCYLRLILTFCCCHRTL